MVIHARGPKYQFDEHPAEYLAAALWSALRLADANHAARVAVPAISMGVYAYPADEAVQILVQHGIDLPGTPDQYRRDSLCGAR